MLLQCQQLVTKGCSRFWLTTSRACRTAADCRLLHCSTATRRSSSRHHCCSWYVTFDIVATHPLQCITIPMSGKSTSVYQPPTGHWQQFVMQPHSWCRPTVEDHRLQLDTQKTQMKVGPATAPWHDSDASKLFGVCNRARLNYRAWHWCDPQQPHYRSWSR